MRPTRLAVPTVLLAAALALALSACGSSGGSDGAAATGGSDQAQDMGGGDAEDMGGGDAEDMGGDKAQDMGDAKDEMGDEYGEPGGVGDEGDTSGAAIEATLSSGATLSGVPDECDIQDGSGSVRADDGAFVLTFADGTGTLTWTVDGQDLDEEVTVVAGDQDITVTGVTADGVGYNASITCA